MGPSQGSDLRTFVADRTPTSIYCLFVHPFVYLSLIGICVAAADSVVDMIQRVIRVHAFLWVLFCSPSTRAQCCKCTQYLYSCLVVLEIQKGFNASHFRKGLSSVRWTLTVNLPVQLPRGLDIIGGCTPENSQPRISCIRAAIGGLEDNLHQCQRKNYWGPFLLISVDHSCHHDNVALPMSIAIPFKLLL